MLYDAGPDSVLGYPAFTMGKDRELGTIFQFALHQQVADMCLDSFDANM